MDKRTKKELIGVSLLGTAVAIGVAYANRKNLREVMILKNIIYLRGKITLHKILL